ncbi:MAG: hypothetical protein U0704_08660 [Candidatus Eisenbacteria bacterium]
MNIPRWLLFVPALGLLAAAPPPPAATFAPADPHEVVETERMFARTVDGIGIKAGFLAYLAPTGVLFRPGPVNGVKAMEATPVSPATLAWMPERVVLASSSDLAMSTGPWSYHPIAHKPAVAWGTFLSLWRRSADGKWKLVLDAGIEHARPAADSVDAIASKLAPPARAGKGPLARRQTLWQADVAFAKAAGTAGVSGALDQFAAIEHRRLREGSLPIVGRTAARDSAAVRDERGTFMSLAQFISAGGDLGYTYGTFVQTRGAEVDSSYYVHVWQRGADKPWELLLDMLLPQPKPAK